MVKPWGEVEMSKCSSVKSSGRREQIRIVSSLNVFSINHQIPQGRLCITKSTYPMSLSVDNPKSSSLLHWGQSPGPLGDMQFCQSSPVGSLWHSDLMKEKSTPAKCIIFNVNQGKIKHNKNVLQKKKTIKSHCLFKSSYWWNPCGYV